MADKKGKMKATDINPWKLPGHEGEPPYAPFNAFIYALEKFVPLVKLDMGDFWIPDANDRFGRLLLVFLHFYIFAGWVLTTLWFAGLTGILKT